MGRYLIESGAEEAGDAAGLDMEPTAEELGTIDQVTFTHTHMCIHTHTRTHVDMLIHLHKHTYTLSLRTAK